MVFGNTPPAEIFDSDDGEGGSSIATTYEMSSPPPTSTYHPSTWVNCNVDSPVMVSPMTQNDPFVSESQVSAVKSQPMKLENPIAIIFQDLVAILSNVIDYHCPL